VTTTAPTLLARIQHWLERIPLAIFVAIALVVGLVKTGIRINPLPGADAENFPQISNSWSATQFGMRGLVWLLGPNSSSGFVLVGVAISTVVVLYSAIVLSRQFSTEVSRILILVLIAGPIGGTLYTTIGQNDSLMILGSLVVATSKRRIGLVALGLVLMVAANPEQAVVAWGVLLIMSFAPVLRSWRWTSAFGFIAAAMSAAVIAALVRGSGSEDKSQFLDDFLLQSLHNFWSNLPLSVYALFGFSWPIVLVLMWYQGSRSRIVGALALLPAFLATAITIDQTRVLIGVTALATLTWLGASLRDIDFDKLSFPVTNRLSWTFLLSLVLPSIIIYGPSGLPMGPYAWIFFALFGDQPLW